ncbi:MAG: hypothetical protein KGJ21_06740, partial [Pseudomonadota bacterium]|nr:hypothetical protein [Pseudomonadota bacterium]
TGANNTVSAGYGIYIPNNATVYTTGSGAIKFTGIGGPGDTDIYSSNSGGNNQIGGSSDTGSILFNADTLTFANSTPIQTTGMVTFAPRTSSTTIGVAGGAGTLGITSGVLGGVTAGSITIGNSADSGAMTVGAYTWASPVTFDNGSGNIEFSGAQTLGTNSLTAVTASGNIVMDQNARIASTASSGNSIILASGGNFINNDSNDGSSALSPGSGTARYLVYSADPSLNTLSGLSDAGIHIFNKTYAGYPPGSVTQTGNLFLYSLAPTITVTADNQSRLYGAADPAFTYTLSGLVDGDTGSILSGSPSFSTPGGDTATSAAGNTYTITTALNTLANSIGYGLATANGTLTINKAHLTVTADNQSMTYGAGSLPSLTDTITGFANSENAASAGVTGAPTLSTTATAYNGTAGSGSNAGSYAITAAAGNLAAANYDFAYANGTLTVNKAILTATADNQSRRYGQSNPTFTETVSGYANGDTSAILTGSATGSSTATSTSSAGSYIITGSTGTLGVNDGNYTFAAANGNLIISGAAFTVTTYNQIMAYDVTDPSSSPSFLPSGNADYGYERGKYSFLPLPESSGLHIFIDPLLQHDLDLPPYI